MPTKKRSLFSLLGSCTLHSIAIALSLAILLASVAMALDLAHARDFSAQPVSTADAPATATFAGVITDSSCNARHAADSGRTPADCTRACVRDGSKYTLVDGDKVHTLEGSVADLDRVAGQRAQVVGTLDGDTIKVSAVIAQ